MSSKPIARYPIYSIIVCVVPFRMCLFRNWNPIYINRINARVRLCTHKMYELIAPHTRNTFRQPSANRTSHIAHPQFMPLILLHTSPECEYQSYYILSITWYSIHYTIRTAIVHVDYDDCALTLHFVCCCRDFRANIS